MSDMKDEVLKRLWVRKALETQKAVQVRMLNKELVGSDIHTLRTKEVEFIDKLIKEYTK